MRCLRFMVFVSWTLALSGGCVASARHAQGDGNDQSSSLVRLENKHAASQPVTSAGDGSTSQGTSQQGVVNIGFAWAGAGGLSVFLINKIIDMVTDLSREHTSREVMNNLIAKFGPVNHEGV